MSDAPPLDIREQIVRIDRMIEESAKFRSEQQKLVAEQQKLVAEQQKLIAESFKLNRDRVIAPWLAVAAVIGGALGLATFLSRLLEH